jgi:hypothetical protein
MSEYFGDEKSPPGKFFRDGSPTADGFADVRRDMDRAMGKMEGSAPRWVRTTVMWSDILAGPSPMPVIVRPGGSVPMLVHDGFIRVVRNFTGGTLSDMTVVLGRRTDTDAIVSTPLDVHTTAADGTQANAVRDGWRTTDKGAGLPAVADGDPAPSPFLVPNLEYLVVEFSSTSDDPANATAGELEVWFLLAEPVAVTL